ncbi:hypothetical protein DVA76_18160, partial [Acinetobacter baumannii]
ILIMMIYKVGIRINQQNVLSFHLWTLVIKCFKHFQTKTIMKEEFSLSAAKTAEGRVTLGLAPPSDTRVICPLLRPQETYKWRRSAAWQNTCL